jgi:hypothetical protein
MGLSSSFTREKQENEGEVTRQVEYAQMTGIDIPLLALDISSSPQSN